MSKLKETKMDTEILIEEFNAIRAEINLKQSNTQTVTNFSIILTIGLLGAITIKEVDEDIKNLLLLIFPIMQTILSYVFAYEVFHISLASSFINKSIRKRIAKNQKTSSDKVLQWDNYKLKNKNYLNSFLDFSRWLVFLAPSIGSIIIFLQLNDKLMTYELVILIIDNTFFNL